MLGLPGAAAGSDRLFFALGAFASSLSWQLLVASAGALLHGRLPARLQVASRLLGSLVVLAFAASLVLAARPS
jgi:arginine exporter protein ArgO